MPGTAETAASAEAEMNYQIRELRKKEYRILGEYIYRAIYSPPGTPRPPVSIVGTPAMQVYIENFGSRRDDFALAAETSGLIIGAVWARIMNDFGHIDDRTPSLALAVHESCRGRGIGTALMKTMIAALTKRGYSRVSLSVQKSNPAFRMYRRLGFETVGRTMGETEEEIVMCRRLGPDCA